MVSTTFDNIKPGRPMSATNAATHFCTFTLLSAQYSYRPSSFFARCTTPFVNLRVRELLLQLLLNFLSQNLLHRIYCHFAVLLLILTR